MRDKRAGYTDAGGYVTLAEAARELGVSRQRVAQLVQLGRLGTLTIRGRVYVTCYSVKVLAAYRDKAGAAVADQIHSRRAI